MKQLFLTAFLLMAFIANSVAQTYQVNLETNDPDKVYSNFIAPLFGYEIANNFDFYIGATTRWSFVEKFDVEGVAGLDVFQLNGKGPGFLFEGGIFLPFSEKEKVKDVPVVLDYNPFAGSRNINGSDYRVEETKYIKIPGGKYLNKTGLHAGVYMKKVGAKGDDIKAPGTSDIKAAVTHTGLYLGLQKSSQAYVKVNLDQKVNRIGAAFVRYYADVLFLPVSQVSEPIIESALKKNGTFGWRAGFQWYLDPHDGEYKRLGKSVLTAEIGSKPLTGFFANMSWGFAIINSNK